MSEETDKTFMNEMIGSVINKLKKCVSTTKIYPSSHTKMIPCSTQAPPSFDATFIHVSKQQMGCIVA